MKLYADPSLEAFDPSSFASPAPSLSGLPAQVQRAYAPSQPVQRKGLGSGGRGRWRRSCAECETGPDIPRPMRAAGFWCAGQRRGAEGDSSVWPFTSRSIFVCCSACAGLPTAAETGSAGIRSSTLSRATGPSTEISVAAEFYSSQEGTGDVCTASDIIFCLAVPGEWWGRRNGVLCPRPGRRLKTRSTAHTHSHPDSSTFRVCVESATGV